MVAAWCLGRSEGRNPGGGLMEVECRRAGVRGVNESAEKTGCELAGGVGGQARRVCRQANWRQV